MASKANAIGAMTAIFAFAACVSAAPASGDELPCDDVFARKPACSPAVIDQTCVCDLTQLRPLQGAVGLAEVADKEAKIKDKKCERLKEKFEPDPIKVVADPGGQLYVTDHHHGALALLRVEKEWHEKGKWGNEIKGLCMAQPIRDDDGKPAVIRSEDDFWVALKAAHLVHSKDKDGVPLANPSQQLPKTLESLPDDPYRSLAWKVRDKGFCRPECSKDYLEFHWADFFRKHQDRLPMHDVERLTTDPDLDKKLVKAADDLAQHSEDAKKIIGYKPDGQTCGETGD